MKMSEEPEQETKQVPVQPSCAASDGLMDLDFDLDACWPLDQIFAAAAAASGPGSPFFIANSEQPCSPLLVFPDDSHDGGFVSNGGFRLSHCSKFPVPSCMVYTVLDVLLFNLFSLYVL